MPDITQVSSQNVSTPNQIFALKKSMQASSEMALSLLQGATENAAAIGQAVQSSNPAHLGQNVDVSA